MSVEIENAKQEIEEIIDKCIKCGLCKSRCPVFKVIREECVSPRGKVSLFESGFFDKIVYDCTLCGACEQDCPLGLKLCDAFINARKMLVFQKKGIDENEEMIRNLNKRGNVFGEKE
ncbi:(Fe-S)-binding protein [archaeon]|jgi:Fe-S oxidoreductase|nr:(Fe-S)-binding protein [archaeon]